MEQDVYLISHCQEQSNDQLFYPLKSVAGKVKLRWHFKEFSETNGIVIIYERDQETITKSNHQIQHAI